MKKNISLSVIILFTFIANAQVYIEGGKTRHRFAQLNLGTEAKYYSPFNTSEFRRNDQGIWQERAMNHQFQQNFIIGGTHFWGHADFYISIPLFSLGESFYRRSAETGVKVYPWQIEHHKVRPFVGLAWSPSSYGSKEGSRKYTNEFPLAAGFTFNHSNWLFDLSAQYAHWNELEYASSTTTFHAVRTPSLNINASLKWMFDTTLGAEKGWQNGRTKVLTDTLSKLKKLDGLTISLGASSAIFLSPSNHNQLHYPYLHEHRFSDAFIETGIGYYFYKRDLHLNLSYRGVKSKQAGFGQSQIAHRRSLSLEATKFLGDYHGFVPFIGVSGSYEWLRLDETNELNSIDYKTNKPVAGVVFGWDIRPDNLQLLYLRTNLRWYPKLTLSTSSQASFSFSQLEFNFITLVLMVNRLF